MLVRVEPSKADRLAGFISVAMSPPIVVISAWSLATFLSAPAVPTRLWLEYSVLAVAMPIFALGLLVKAGIVGDFDISDVRQRWRPTLAAVVGSGAAFGCIYAEAAPRHLQIFGLAQLLILLTVLFVSLVWKISVHSAACAAAFSTATMVVGLEGMLVLPALFAVGWSRIRLEKHTPAQVLVGAAVAITIFALAQQWL